jgi:peroxiredoxin
LAEYEAAGDAFAEAGFGLAALSVDDPARSDPVRRELGLHFPLLCDSGRHVVRAWDLYNAEERGGIAVPAVFALDRERRVLLASVDRTAARVHPDATLAFARARARGQAPPSLRRGRVVPRLRDAVRALANAFARGHRTPWR